MYSNLFCSKAKFCMISLFIRQISNLSTISICLPRNGAHDESRSLAKADCYMLWSGSLVGETKYKLCAIPLPRTISSCAPFQPLPICLSTRVFCFDPCMCARSAQKGPSIFVQKTIIKSIIAHGYPKQIRVDSPVHPLMKSHWQIMWVATWWTDYLRVNSFVTQATTSNVPKTTIDSEVGVSKRSI